MATYNEASLLAQQLRPIIDREIESHPLVRSAIKVKKAIVQGAPDSERHTVPIKFLSDLFNTNTAALTYPYNPSLSADDLKKGKAVFVFYFQSLSNGVIMQNATWTAGGTGGEIGGIAWDDIMDKPDLALKTDLSDYVSLNTEQLISGKKTFNSKTYFNEDAIANLKEFIATGYSSAAGLSYTGISLYGEDYGQPENILIFPKKSGTFVLTSDLEDYVTTNTQQTISAKKSFGGSIDVYGGGVGVDDDADHGAVYHANGILHREAGIPEDRVSGDENSWFLSFPAKDGTLVVDKDLKDYVSLDTEQYISGKKYFNGGIISQTDNGGEFLVEGSLYRVSTSYGLNSITRVFLSPLGFPQTENQVLHFPNIRGEGTIALTRDITWSNMTGKPSWIGSSKPSYSYSEIDDAPLSLKNPYPLILTIEDSSSGTINIDYDGSSQKTVVLSDLVKGFVTLDTDETIEGQKTFSKAITVSRSSGTTTIYGPFIDIKNEEEGGVMARYGTTYIIRQLPNGNPSYIELPSAEGTLALTTDIKTYTASTGISISTSNAISTTAASSTASGHVSTGAQTFAGRKTFNGGINFPSGATIQIGGSSGAEGQVLTSHGTSKNPTWETPSGGGSALDYFRIGYVYISYTSTSPASMFGGSWTAITGRFPYFNAGTSTGGSNTHTLTAEEMPNHTHAIHTSTIGWLPADGIPRSVIKNSNYYSGVGTAINGSFSDQFGTEVSSPFISGAGGGKSFNTMPSYQTLYAWRRTA